MTEGRLSFGLDRAIWLAALLFAAGALAGTPCAIADDRPAVITHQSYVEMVTRRTGLPIEDPIAMFAFVLGSLPERVKVYPTENYFYFHFYHNNIRYAGNIRLDAKDRDLGKVHFAYFEDLTEWREEPPITYRLLDESAGVKVEKLDRFLYRVTHSGKTVEFELNDLSNLKPPPHAITSEERYIGPVFDDSALRFFLMYNPRLKLFHYVLDETVPAAEQFIAARQTRRILIGKRSGFAFYRDQRRDRKILIGVFEGNARVNNSFDGPFDQLPDNFIEGESLREALVEVEPSLKGKIDRYGGLSDGSGRFLIGPYTYYRTEDDLMPFHACAVDKQIPAEDYYACFVMDSTGTGQTLAVQRLAMRQAAQAQRKPRTPRKTMKKTRRK